MKILVVSHGSTLNGAERCLFEMLKALSGLGHRLFVVFPYHGPVTNVCIAYAEECVIINQPWWTDRGTRLTLWQKLKRFREIIGSVKVMRRYLKKIYPDVVITNTSVIPCGAIAAKITRNKHIWFLHESGREDHGFHFLYGERFSLWMLNRLSTGIIVNSHFIKRKYEKHVSPNKLYLIYYAVEISEKPVSHPVNDCPINLIFMGRFAEGKGQLEAVKAIELLKKSGETGFRLFLVGAGRDNYTLRVQAYINEQKLQDIVEVIPFTPFPEMFYSRAHIALVCSRCEAFGRITIEAGKAGLPVIASDTGANPELIKDGFNGYLYQYGNPQDLADKILSLKNPELRRKIGNNAQAHAYRTFNMEKYAYDLEQAIKSIVM